jgi:hypothetical protein
LSGAAATAGELGSGLLEPLAPGEVNGSGDSSSTAAASIATEGASVTSRGSAMNAAGEPDAPQEGSSSRAEGWETW